MKDQTPSGILEHAYHQAANHSSKSFVDDEEIREKIDYVCRSQTRSGIRALLACSLAKVHNPLVDIRKPYANLGNDSYSGRTYDERYVISLINNYNLPCTSTTAFLTPAFRTKNIALVPGINLGGRPAKLYEYIIALLNYVEAGYLSAECLLVETIRNLLVLKYEKQRRISSLLDALEQSEDEITLSSEDIVSLVQQHIGLTNTSRLPVLVVAAAYQAAAEKLGERILPLQAHNAADEQTGALGDLEIMLVGDGKVVTSYEMKMKQVTKDDVDRALQKVRNLNRVDNYIFITTEKIDEDVTRYAQSLYAPTGGIEFVILDCIGFLRHCLHLFHRLRLEFLEAYQQLVLKEPESAVRQALKEAFLALRQVAESRYTDENTSTFDHNR